MKKVAGSNRCSETILRLTVGCIVLALLIVLLPGGAAERETGAETNGIYHGYRMLDGAEPDGPVYNGYIQLLGVNGGPSEVPITLDLPLPFSVYGCPNDSVSITVTGLDFPFCGDFFEIDVSSTEGMFYSLEIGLDSRGVPANLIWLNIGSSPYFVGVVTLAVDGTVEVHVDRWEDILTWYPHMLGEAISWQPPQSNTVARWEPLGALENDEEALDQEADVVLPPFAIELSPGPFHVPGVPPQELGPFGLDPIPVETPEILVSQVCTPLDVLCVGPFTVPGQDFGTTPGVGPVGPLYTPGTPGATVQVPVDLEVGHGEIRVKASTAVPEPGTWDGVEIIVPVPVIGDVPVSICKSGCPFPLLPEHEIYGSVLVRGTIGDVVVDEEVPFRVGG